MKSNRSFRRLNAIALRFASLLAVSIALIVASPLRAETVEELKKLLEKKNAEIATLKKKLSERETPQAPHENGEATSGKAVLKEAGKDEEASRALERTLQTEGGALLPAYALQITPSVDAAIWDKGRNTTARNDESASVSIDFGLPYASQISVFLPYERYESISDTQNGFGSFGASVSKQLLTENESTPALVASIGASISPDAAGLDWPSISDPGFASISASLFMSKRVDPAVFFGGFSVSDPMAREYDSKTLEPGMTYRARVGGLVALSPKLSLNMAFNLSETDAYQIDGTAISGTDSMAGTYSIGISKVLTPSLALIASGSARIMGPGPDFGVSVALPYRF